VTVDHRNLQWPSYNDYLMNYERVRNVQNRIAVLFAIGCMSLLISACSVGSAVQTLGMVNNVRAGYQGVESIATIKSVKDKTPVFRNYNSAFVMVDVQPRGGSAIEINRTIETVYSRTVNDLAADFDMRLTCKPYTQVDVEALDSALIIQVYEEKRSTIGKLLAGENIHALVRYIDKKSAQVLAEEELNSQNNYEVMISLMSTSAMLKIIGNGPAASDRNVSETEQKTWAEKVKAITNGKKKYPMLLPSEKEILAKG